MHSAVPPAARRLFQAGSNRDGGDRRRARRRVAGPACVGRTGGAATATDTARSRADALRSGSQQLVPVCGVRRARPRQPWPRGFPLRWHGVRRRPDGCSAHGLLAGRRRKAPELPVRHRRKGRARSVAHASISKALPDARSSKSSWGLRTISVLTGAQSTRGSRARRSSRRSPTWPPPAWPTWTG